MAVGVAIHIFTVGTTIALTVRAIQRIDRRVARV
jgi:hypothetical protein